jgi:ATP-dependent Clp protease ATP-binding subunit ClpA
MTSNLGAEHFRKLSNPLGFRSATQGIQDVESEVMRELERRFAPEFRNRIDDVVLFSPLAKDEVREIAQHYLAKIEETLRVRRKTITIDPEALEALVEEGHSLAYGARFLRRVIDERVRLPLSQHWADGSNFHFKAENGRVVLETNGPRLALAYGT